jgi:hypothetical protein
VPRKQTTDKTHSTTARRRKTSSQTTSQKITLKHPVDLTDKVRRRAYEIYIQRGYHHGNDLGDWLQAEKEVKKQYSLVNR